MIIQKARARDGLILTVGSRRMNASRRRNNIVGVGGITRSLEGAVSRRSSCQLKGDKFRRTVFFQKPK
jgi:hypothetical protein